MLLNSRLEKLTKFILYIILIIFCKYLNEIPDRAWRKRG
ncbi:Uncharacterized protein dnm_088940 [Desulfonema magnum]|uniref:Uncharacterized protein n=1 Tax=Desulfonema magnum TaxID=45655 RepID=A0A975GTB2_9BACT|nr:Uncharacterized protein dnm_088940 [Desulfonema magnum]